MKRTMTTIACGILSLLLLLSAASCTNKIDTEKLWKSAAYSENTEIGEGAITVEVEVKAGERSVTFTLHTDKTTLGDALLEHELIAGDVAQYGLYVKEVNGITADYDVDQSYWSFYKNGEYLMAGVDSTEIADGEHYEIVYSK